MLVKLRRAFLLALVFSLIAIPVFAQDGEISNSELAYAIDNVVLFIAAVLVIFMQAGFALVEAGFNSAKNSVNILFKNLLDFGAGVLVYWLVGYSIMYGSSVLGGFMGWGGFGISATPPEAIAGNLNPQVDFLFQVAFAATAATIVSGAVAGRMKFEGYLIYSVVITAFIYPVSGFWKWGGGWLDAMGFYDFAGSLVVHSVGGFAGLAGAILLGPRIGRFAKDSDASTFAPSNYVVATLGVFILWVGWYGFNPGSQLAFAGAANTDVTMLIAVNTTLAAGAGVVIAMIVSWLMKGHPDLGITLNGGLAGLVGITANCDSVTNGSAIIIGAIAGVLVVAGMELLERLKIDDPVGAWPVHGLCGIWGGIATGIFGGHPLGAQIIGSLVIPLWAFVCAFILFSILKAVNLLRVSPEDEHIGLDRSEHGAGAYAGLASMSSGDD
ncbi:MAG: ammonium transporter [Caldilineaceae bacterium]|nr:ammonium transporter [Caldilineaceae bacterium]